jgi:hypothetical protein
MAILEYSINKITRPPQAGAQTLQQLHILVMPDTSQAYLPTNDHHINQLHLLSITILI